MKDLVIFVPGWGARPYYFKLTPLYCSLSRHYKTKLWRNCDLGWPDIEHNGETLASYINGVKYDGDIRKIFLIGHSLGGLVALSAAHMAGADAVITIGAPLRGAPMARLMASVSKAARQMMPHSELLDWLDSLPPDFHYMNVACKFDLAVGDYKNSISCWADRTCVLLWGHASVLWSRQLQTNVLEFLSEKGYTRFGERDNSTLGHLFIKDR